MLKAIKYVTVFSFESVYVYFCRFQEAAADGNTDQGERPII